MANPWFRLWGDMVNDPKWRTIARRSGQKISDVIAVYLHMLTCASNASERGCTEGWNSEDVASALDIEIEQVEAIRESMQGRVLDGDCLTGWERRQPAREDEGAAARAKAWREKQKAPKEQQQTPPNAPERKQTLKEIREEEIREEGKKHAAVPKYSALDDLVSNGVERRIACDWLAVRRSKKAAPTKTAIDGVLRELGKAGFSPADGIRLCSERAWARFNPDWLQSKGQPSRAHPHGTGQLSKPGQVTAVNAMKWLAEQDAS